MSVAFVRSGNTFTVTTVVDVTDIVAAVATSTANKELQSLQRALRELSDAVGVFPRTDEQIDTIVTTAEAEAERLKDTRPTGSF